MCEDLTGYPSLRDERARSDFFSSGGVQTCTEERIRLTVEKVLELAATVRAVE